MIGITIWDGQRQAGALTLRMGLCFAVLAACAGCSDGQSGSASGGQGCSDEIADIVAASGETLDGSYCQQESLILKRC
ncbi:MAG: hypothetical protein LBJ02_11105 [Bifidobacteriaceae bacterium]|jgi:hypothetical protein|nr:hypothetical protein [Bifidobacteriaceae bacterium]